MDPRNVTLEPEYYADCDDARFQRVKPLLWLWYSFDRSPLGGQNVWLGVELRRLLAKHIFKRCGENFKAFHNVEFSFGYNMEVGDNVVVHRNVLLDDRGGIVLGNNVSISDYANIYSHTHSIVDAEGRHERDDGASTTACASPTTPRCSPACTCTNRAWSARWPWRRRTCGRITCTSAFRRRACG